MTAGSTGSERATPDPATGESLPAPVRAGSRLATVSRPIAAGFTLPFTPGNRDGRSRP